MLTGIDKLGKFYLHVGGIGDLFYTLSAGYDKEKEMNIPDQFVKGLQNDSIFDR